MTWENYGTLWQVDHVLPVSRFDHTDDQQIRQCWNWQNLKPLRAVDNLAKRDRITDGQLPLTLTVSIPKYKALIGRQGVPTPQLVSVNFADGNPPDDRHPLQGPKPPGMNA